MSNQSEDKKYETIGRVICTLSYWWYAFKIIISITVPAAVMLFLLGYPIWIAPLIGIGVFLIYRFIRRTIFRILYKMSRM